MLILLEVEVVQKDVIVKLILKEYDSKRFEIYRDGKFLKQCNGNLEMIFAIRAECPEFLDISAKEIGKNE